MDLTGNDLALAQMAAQLAIAWHRRTPESDFRTKEMEKLGALCKKLDTILNENSGIIDATDGECEFEVRDYYEPRWSG